MTSLHQRPPPVDNFAGTPAPARSDTALKRKPLGRFLVETGVISADQLVDGLTAQMRLQAPLGEILVANGWASEADICRALAQQHVVPIADFGQTPPDPKLCARRSAEAWLRDRLLAWRRTRDGIVLIATDRLDAFDAHRPHLEKLYGKVAPVVASAQAQRLAIAQLFATPLARAASRRTRAEYSSRNWHWGHRLPLPFLVVVFCIAVLFAPVTTLAGLTVLSLVTMAMFALLKAAAIVKQLTHHPSLIAPPPIATLPARYRLPKVSVLVPLYREKEIANVL
ncbi:MAG: hypothetical protein AB3N11_07160, partial [Arenibacterium sp.]